MRNIIPGKHGGKQKSSAMRKKEEVQQNPDMHIDQDFPGYPHGHAKEEIITPKTKTQKKTAGISKKDQ